MVIRSILMLAVCMVIMFVSGNAVTGVIRIKKVRLHKTSKYWIIIFLIHSAAVNFSTYGSIAAISVTACITLYYIIKKQKISYFLMAIVASMPSVSTAVMTYITTFKK